ncbi:hypothetical protein [Synergistes jonesii]|uniref:hypothetical protein n=1 Tax=Synergistes jonesii TaxID=2754 RepID=UPI0033203A3E
MSHFFEQTGDFFSASIANLVSIPQIENPSRRPCLPSAAGKSSVGCAMPPQDQDLTAHDEIQGEYFQVAARSWL